MKILNLSLFVSGILFFSACGELNKDKKDSPAPAAPAPASQPTKVEEKTPEISDTLTVKDATVPQRRLYVVDSDKLLKLMAEKEKGISSGKIGTMKELAKETNSGAPFCRIYSGKMDVEHKDVGKPTKDIHIDFSFIKDEVVPDDDDFRTLKVGTWVAGVYGFVECFKIGTKPFTLKEFQQTFAGLLEVKIKK